MSEIAEAWEHGYATSWADEYMSAIYPLPAEEVDAEKERSWRCGIEAARRHPNHPNNRKDRAK